MIDQAQRLVLGGLVGAVLLTGLSERAGSAAEPRPELPPDTVWADQAAGVEFAEAVRMPAGAAAEYPAIAAAGSRVFVAWVQREQDRERIMAAEATEQGVGEPKVISGDADLACWPAMTTDKDGRVWAAYAGRQGGRWRVYLRQVHPEADGTATVAPLRRDEAGRACWHPAIAAAEDGSLWLAWEESSAGECDVVAVRFDGRRFGEPLRVAATGPAFRPALAAGGGRVWLAWDALTDGRQYDVYLTPLSAEDRGEPLRVTRHPALDAAPALAVDCSGRPWVAWHSDRSGERAWDIPKWVYVRCWDGEKWLAPAAPVPGRQADPRGEDQGFEFPTIRFDADGRLWLSGRPSHGFNAVYYAGDKWSPVQRLLPHGWGGRGPQVASVSVGRSLWTVRRDLQNNLLQRVGIPDGPAAEPVLRPAEDGTGPEIAPPPPPDVFPSLEKAPVIGEYQVYFGDLHMHTSLSDGMGTPDELYARARSGYRFDFAAVTDHDDFVGNAILAGEWENLQAVANVFNNPGRFATLCAYEWTGLRVPKGDGHKNVYFRAGGPLLRHTDAASADGAKLVDRLTELRAFCVPHHVGWTGVDWDQVGSAAEPVVEMVSVHGAYEFSGNEPIKHRGDLAGQFVRDALGRGRKFGLIGGTDAHGLAWHHGIARRRNPWTCGLTAVLAKELSREAVWDALAARRCYATSGPRIVLDFQVDGHLMGSEYAASSPPTITARVLGASALQSVAVIRGGEEIYRAEVEGARAEIRLVDETWPSAAGETCYYYLRVLQQDGEMAWSSPVFVAGAAPPTATRAVAPR